MTQEQDEKAEEVCFSECEPVRFIILIRWSCI